MFGAPSKPHHGDVFSSQSLRSDLTQRSGDVYGFLMFPGSTVISGQCPGAFMMLERKEKWSVCHTLKWDGEIIGSWVSWADLFLAEMYFSPCILCCPYNVILDIRFDTQLRMRISTFFFFFLTMEHLSARHPCRARGRRGPRRDLGSVTISLPPACPPVVPLMMCEGENTGQLAALFSQGTMELPPFLPVCRWKAKGLDLIEALQLDWESCGSVLTSENGERENNAAHYVGKEKAIGCVCKKKKKRKKKHVMTAMSSSFNVN